jgi:hypothetical protein
MEQPIVSVLGNAIAVLDQRPYRMYAIKKVVNKEKIKIDVAVLVQYLECVPKSGIQERIHM